MHFAIEDCHSDSLNSWEIKTRGKSKMKREMCVCVRMKESQRTNLLFVIKKKQHIHLL